MKRSVLFSLVLFVGFGLHGMEVEEDSTTFPFDQLPPELQCKIVRLALPDQMKIAPKDAVQDVAEYAHDDSVWSVAVSPDGKWVVSGGEDKKVKIADAATGEVHEYAHDNSVWSVAVSPDGTWVVSGGFDNKVKIVDAATGEVLHEYAHDGPGRVNSVAVSSDGKWVVSGGFDNKVKIADAATGEVHEYAHDGPVWSVAVSSDGTWVVSGGDDKKVKIADAATGKILHEYAHDGRVNSVAVSPDGKWVVSGGSARKVKIADAATGEVLHEYAHDGWVNSVAVSPDGQWVVSGGRDRKVKIADAATGKLLAEYAHDGAVSSVAVSPDGKWVVSGGHKKVKIKSIIPLLLAQYQLPEETTLSRYSLLKRAQESLLIKKKPLIIGKSDRDTLEEMPELKELLKIETNKNTKGKVATLWRLQMKYAPDIAGDGKSEQEDERGGWLNNCVVM